MTTVNTKKRKTTSIRGKSTPVLSHLVSGYGVSVPYKKQSETSDFVSTICKLNII